MVGFLLSQDGIFDDRIRADLETIFLSSFDFYVEAIRLFLKKRDFEYFVNERLALFEEPKTEANLIRKKLIDSLQVGQHVTISGGFLDSAKFIEITYLGATLKGAKKYYRVRIFNNSQFKEYHPILRQAHLGNDGQEEKVEFLSSPIFEFNTDDLAKYNYFLYADEAENHFSKIYPSFNPVNYNDAFTANLTAKPDLGLWDYLRASLGIAKYTQVHVKVLAHFYEQMKKLYQIPPVQADEDPAQNAATLNWAPREVVLKRWRKCKALKGGHVDILMLGQMKEFERDLAKHLPEGKEKTDALDFLQKTIDDNFPSIPRCFPNSVKTLKRRDAKLNLISSTPLVAVEGSKSPSSTPTDIVTQAQTAQEAVAKTPTPTEGGPSQPPTPSAPSPAVTTQPQTVVVAQPNTTAQPVTTEAGSSK